jgi:hypothetical protein
MREANLSLTKDELEVIQSACIGLANHFRDCLKGPHETSVDEANAHIKYDFVVALLNGKIIEGLGKVRP